MAKINWVFQDESVTNPNRYIATNVATGEKVTFDLLRGGTVKVVGTPLNAEKLNSLITAINGSYDGLRDLELYIGNVDMQTEQNASSISTVNTRLTNDIKNVSTRVTNLENKHLYVHNLEMVYNTDRISIYITFISKVSTKVTDHRSFASIFEAYADFPKLVYFSVNNDDVKGIALLKMNYDDVIIDITILNSFDAKTYGQQVTAESFKAGKFMYFTEGYLTFYDNVSPLN